jgi:hypothetical protein
MLNRTNRTLSANLNRLNLGTRSLALQASANFGGETLRIRHAHLVVMRDGMVGMPMDSISRDPWRITDIPGSSPVPPRPPAGQRARPYSKASRLSSGNRSNPLARRSRANPRSSVANRLPVSDCITRGKVVRIWRLEPPRLLMPRVPRQQVDER